MTRSLFSWRLTPFTAVKDTRHEDRVLVHPILNDVGRRAELDNPFAPSWPSPWSAALRKPAKRQDGLGQRDARSLRGAIALASEEIR